VQREQAIDRSNSDSLEGARYLVTGSISLLGDDDRDIGAVVAGAAGRSLGLGAGLSALFTNTRRTTMRVTVRVVDNRTGEIIGSFTSEGRSKTRWGGSFASIGSGGMKAGSMSSRNFRGTAIGEAGDRAASDIAEHLIAMRAQRLRP
jgi:curli biogenesis system outer membrane secretion channel CsgG